MIHENAGVTPIFFLNSTYRLNQMFKNYTSNFHQSNPCILPFQNRLYLSKGRDWQTSWCSVLSDVQHLPVLSGDYNS